MCTIVKRVEAKSKILYLWGKLAPYSLYADNIEQDFQLHLGQVEHLE